jgi:hypothetical protein
VTVGEEQRMQALREWIAEGEAEHGPPTAEDLTEVERILAPLREREATQKQDHFIENESK